ncbi:MAG: transcription termination factor Rho, partial [Hamadaea sp.]|nr:transcription termination factor Rho [Hamadaea sp.]
MSDTTDTTSDVSTVADDASAGTARRRRSGSGLTAMLLPELQSMAASLGISGTARMRKGELISAIQERQAGTPRPRAEVAATAGNTRDEVRAEVRDAAATTTEAPAERPAERERPRRASRAAGPPAERTRDTDRSRDTAQSAETAAAP